MCKLEKMGAISARICGACEDVAMSFLFSALARLVLGCEMEGVAVLSSLLFFSFPLLAALRASRQAAGDFFELRAWSRSL